MAIGKLKDIVEQCYLGGQNCISSFRKVPAIASTATGVVDLSMAPGNPRPNYYTGDALTSTLFTSAYGIWHGGNVSPATKVLRKIETMRSPDTITPIEMYMLDYLMFYPLIDMDSTDEQTFTNTVSLPRYTTGEGVRAFLVATNPYLGGAAFTMTYIDHNGNRQTTRLQYSNTHAYIGTIVHSGATTGVSGTFINTDGFGIRYVESITFMGPNGGLAALVLCKPLVTVCSFNKTYVALEWDLLLMKGVLPIIEDGAYLNFIAQVNGSASGVIISGLIETIWN